MVMGTLISKVIVSLSIFLLTGAVFNVSSVKDCEVQQVYKWVQKQKILWLFKSPNISTLGRQPILEGASHNIIGYREDVGYYSGIYHYRTNIAEFLDGDTVVLAHEIAHAFGADEPLAEKIHQKFEQEFEMKECK